MTGSEAALTGGAVGVLVGMILAGAAGFAGRARSVQPRPAVNPVTDIAGEAGARVIEALPFAAFTVDAGGRIRQFNAAASRLFGMEATRAVGRALIEVIPSVELERMVDAALLGLTRTNDIALAPVGEQRFFGVTVQPYEAGAMAIAADRTEYLAGERARREFTGNVSHELRTPLSAMKLMLETLEISDDDAEARALFLPQISAELERMIRLVQDLLELARSENGVVLLRRERFDLAEFAALTLATFGARADAEDVELQIDAPDPVIIDADRGRLTQVLVNLLDNALRHTPGGGTVAVEVRQEGGDAVLRVRDTGIGIPFADLGRVFERFYVVDRSRARAHGGTGLGLAIARGLVEAHGGRIMVTSVYGSGATFNVRIPLEG